MIGLGCAKGRIRSAERVEAHPIGFVFANLLSARNADYGHSMKGGRYADQFRRRRPAAA
jgi:hypothetical protein